MNHLRVKVDVAARLADLHILINLSCLARLNGNLISILSVVFESLQYS